MYETHVRSVVKSLVWRVIATLTSLTLTYIFSGSIQLATEVSLSGAALSIGLYYLHERFWDGVDWGRVKKRSK